MNANHTPLPWDFSINKDALGNTEIDIHQADGAPYTQYPSDIGHIFCIWDVAPKAVQMASAEFIVRACNAHYGLINALQKLRETACESVEFSDWTELQEALQQADAALDKAGAA